MKSFSLCLISLFLLLPIEKSFAHAHDGIKSKKFHMHGKIYLNAKRTGSPGENYLLTEQLSNIKLYGDYLFSQEKKIHALFIYNSVPNPVNPRFYFEELYYQQQLPSSFYGKIGKKWLNFSHYKTDLIYKPLTKALGQTNEYGLEIGFKQFYYGNLALFPPQASNGTLPYQINFGLHNSASEKFHYDIGSSYIYSIAESQLFQYNKGFGGFRGHSLQSRVPGLAAYTHFQYKEMSAHLTYVSALTAFNMAELSYQNSGAKPSAFSIQSTYDFYIKNIPVRLIGFYDQTWQALALQIPKKRAGLALNIYPHRYIDLQMTYFKDYAYNNGSLASGLNNAVLGTGKISDTLAMQVVINF